MDKLRNKILAMDHDGISYDDIARSLGISKITVLDVIQQNFAYKKSRGLA